jgi:hypothetical protein
MQSPWNTFIPMRNLSWIMQGLEEDVPRIKFDSTMCVLLHPWLKLYLQKPVKCLVLITSALYTKKDIYVKLSFWYLQMKNVTFWSRIELHSEIPKLCYTGSAKLEYYTEHHYYVSKKTKLRGLSPRANYTDRATTACRQSDCQLLRMKGATWSAWRIPTAVFSVF